MVVPLKILLTLGPLKSRIATRALSLSLHIWKKWKLCPSFRKPPLPYKNPRCAPEAMSCYKWLLPSEDAHIKEKCLIPRIWIACKHYATRSLQDLLFHSILTTHYNCNLLDLPYSTFLQLITELKKGEYVVRSYQLQKICCPIFT